MSSDISKTPAGAGPAEPAGPAFTGGRRHPDWQPWVPLLIIPIVLPLITSIYNRVDPKLWGIPAFYWIQLLYVFLSAACTAIVYATSKSRRR
jgi:hypothetical protein